MGREKEVQIIFKQHIFTRKVEEAFGHFASGESYQEAADQLNRDIETMKSYGKVIREVLHAKSMIEAVAKAAAKGIISFKEVDPKALIACGLVVLSSFNTDFTQPRPVRSTTRTTRTARRDDAAAGEVITIDQMAVAWHQVPADGRVALS